MHCCGVVLNFTNLKFVMRHISNTLTNNYLRMFLCLVLFVVTGFTASSKTLCYSNIEYLKTNELAHTETLGYKPHPHYSLTYPDVEDGDWREDGGWRVCASRGSLPPRPRLGQAVGYYISGVPSRFL